MRKKRNKAGWAALAKDRAGLRPERAGGRWRPNRRWKLAAFGAGAVALAVTREKPKGPGQPL